jgi:hypothetical protein
MNSARTIALKLLFVVLVFLVLLGALELILPRVINLESVQRTVFGELRDRLHCETEYRKIDFTLFPSPHLVARDVRIWRSEVFDLSLKSMTLFPELGPFFSGEIRIREVVFLNPDIQLSLPPSPAEGPGADESAGSVLDRRLAELSSLDQRMPAHLEFLRLTPIAPTLEIRNGRLALIREGERFLDFDQVQVHGERRSGRLDLTLGSEASFCDRISMQIALDLDDGFGSGQLIVTGLNLEALGSRFLADAPIRMGPSTSSIAVEFAYHQHKGIDMTFDVEVPELTLERGDRTVRLAGARFDAELSLQGQTARFSLSSLRMDLPGLQATGSATCEGRGRDILVEVAGTQVDAAGVREVALGLWEQDKGVRETFEVVLGGHVPRILYRARGRTLRDLKKLENTVIEGAMEGGRIFIPPANLLVEGARGEVEIAGGVLTARNIEGRIGESLARDGLLTLALKKDANRDGPFHLDLRLDADLSGVPPVLWSTVKDSDFLGELALMEEIKGRASGRLVLGERLKAVKTLVEAASFDLSGRYGRVPYPVHLKGTGLRYEGRTLSAQNLEGAVGRSVFEPLSISLDWGNPSRIEIQNHNAMRLDLDEVYPWLLTYPRIQRALESMESLKGAVTIREASLSGPLMEPGRWTYGVEADVESASLRHRFFPDLVHVKSGRLQWTPGRLVLNGCESAFLDAAVSVSGSLGLPKGGLASTDLQIRGSVASRAMQWVFDRAELPNDFRIRGPVTLSNGRFSWNRDRRVAFSGGVVQDGGPRIDLSLRSQPGELSIPSLVVTDREARGTFSVVRRDGAVDLTFDGMLAGSTLDRLLIGNEILEGSVKGSFQSTILPDRPRALTAKGAVEVQGLRKVWKTRVPLEVRQAVLQAEGNRLDVQSARFNLDGSELSFKGVVDVSPEGYVLNMDVEADSLVWEKIKDFKERELTGRGGDGGPERASAKDGSSSVTGSLRVKSDHLHFGSYHFAPVELRVDFRPEGAAIEVSEALLCGISCPGRIEILPRGIRLSADMVARGAPLDESLRCLWGTEGLIDGAFHLEGALSADGPADDLTSSLQGKLELKAGDGRIFPIGFIGKVFSVLNITEIYRGQLPDLTSRGCAYDSITATGAIEDGILSLDNAIVDAHCMKMVWRGTVDLRARTADLILVVAPLRTVDRIVDKVPLLGDILGGSLISFPVRVSGDLRDPDVVPLSPTALGSGFIDFLKRTIRAPFRLMEPLR